MTATLFRKELRDQRPFLLLGALFCVLEVIEVGFTQADMHTLSVHETTMGDFAATLQILLGFAIGTGLLVREQDDGTLRFLDGLPVTRARLFATKLIVAMGVLMLYPTTRLCLLALLHLWARTSLNPEVHLGLLATVWSLIGVATFVGLSAGLLLGFMRSLAWAGFGAFAVALRLLEHYSPRALALDPTELLKPRVVGASWQAPTSAMLAQLGAAAAMAALAGLVFCAGRGFRLSRLAEALRRPFWSAVVVLVTLVAAVATIELWQDGKPRDKSHDADAPATTAHFPTAAPAHLATLHYTFRYPGFSSAPARALAAGADEAFEQVARLLPAGADGPVDVDLSGSSENTAGTAFWGRLRMDPDSAHPTAVLAHETAHVLAFRLVKERGAAVLHRMPVLNEGLAQWICYRAAGGDQLRRRDRLVAAALFKRHEVAFEELVDYEELERKRDQGLKYPLGAALVGALADRYGDQAAQKLLSTLARDEFPSDQRGLALWQAAFQLAGFDLSVVVDTFFKQLEAWAKELQPELDALPRPRGIVEAGKTKLQIRLRTDRELPSGARLAVRLRPTEQSELSEYRTHDARDGVVVVDRGDIAHNRVCFQAGLAIDDAMLFESWQCQPVEWAKTDDGLEP